MTDSGLAAHIATGSTAPGLSELVSAWRTRAVDLRRWAAAEGAACAWERAADELEATLAAADNAVLSLADAARASGYSVDHLSRLIRDGKIPNAGRTHAPAIRRCDLPYKPGSRGDGQRHPSPTDSRTQIARSVVSSFNTQGARR